MEEGPCRKAPGVFFLPDLTVEALRADVIALVERHHLPVPPCRQAA